MIHIYHPNKSITGSACSFWISKDGALMATILKQTGWDATNDNGTFLDAMKDPLKKTSIKFSLIEGCAILDCIERNRPYSSFHDNDENPKSIQFVPWMGKTEPIEQKGFTFSVNVSSKQDSSQKNSFYIGLTFAEARLIREFIVKHLHNNFEPRKYSSPDKLPKEAAEAVEAALTPKKDAFTGL